MSAQHAPVIVTPPGTPARQEAKACPHCGKGPEFRKPVGTFGCDDKFHCVHCGGDW